MKDWINDENEINKNKNSHSIIQDEFDDYDDYKPENTDDLLFSKLIEDNKDISSDTGKTANNNSDFSFFTDTENRVADYSGDKDKTDDIPDLDAILNADNKPEDAAKTKGAVPPPVKKNTKPAKKKPKAGKIFIAAIAVILLIAILGGAIFAYGVCGKINCQPDTHVKNKFIDENLLASDKSVINILVIGTDERANQDTFRSDSMILVSIDKTNKKIKLSSFLRDSWLYIPAKEFSQRLNAACQYGGPQMVIDTIEYNYKVKIDKYVMVDFTVFYTIIKELGGITLDITEAEAACITREGHFECKSGKHKVNARTALWYARIRHLDSDFKRTERQRKVIQAIVAKAKKSSPAVLVSMLNNVLPQLRTDINSTYLMKLGIMGLLAYQNYEIEQMQVPVNGTWANAFINGNQVLSVDTEKNTAELKSFIYG